MNEDYNKTKEFTEEYIKLVSGAYGKQLIQKLSDYLPSNALLLEIGSGPGTDFGILKKSYWF